MAHGLDTHCMGQARNALVASSGDAVIAVGGGYGTLSEIGFALKLGKPVIGLQTWELDDSRAGPGGMLKARARGTRSTWRSSTWRPDRSP